MTIKDELLEVLNFISLKTGKIAPLEIKCAILQIVTSKEFSWKEKDQEPYSEANIISYKCPIVLPVNNLILLKTGYSEKDLKDFFEKLDVTVSRYSMGNVAFGILWFKNGEWIERQYEGEQGQMFWTYFSAPVVPDILL